MSISELASVASLVSAGAVLISLVYLGQQVKQSAKNQRAALLNSTSARSSDQFFRLTEPQNADLYGRLLTSDDTYSKEEIVKLLNMLSAILIGIEDSYLLAAQDLIDDGMLETNMRMSDLLFSLPGPRALWPLMRPFFVPEFATFFEARMALTPVRQQVDMVAVFQANLAAQKRPAP